jgi:hypothetical protein
MRAWTAYNGARFFKFLRWWKGCDVVKSAWNLPIFWSNLLPNLHSYLEECTVISYETAVRMTKTQLNFYQAQKLWSCEFSVRKRGSMGWSVLMQAIQLRITWTYQLIKEDPGAESYLLHCHKHTPSVAWTSKHLNTILSCMIRRKC